MAKIMHTESFIVDQEYDSFRIDAVCSASLESFNRTHANAVDTLFTVNTKSVKKSKKVKAGDTVQVQWSEETFDTIEPQDIPLSVLYEDDAIIVINKTMGMVVHPGSGNWDNTIVNALAFRYGEPFLHEHASQDERPGIVHRLDKDTSGVLIIAKTSQALHELKKQFKERETDKYYIAVAQGFFETRRGSVRSSIVRDEKHRQRFTTTEETGRGKDARTDYLVLKQYRNCALLRIHLYTGRTHQIRVHMRSIGHPLIGDTLYNRQSSHYPLLLHALSLSFIHPLTFKRMKIVSPMPERFKAALKESLM